MYFNINTGVAGTPVGNVLSYNMRAYADGWYRCWMIYQGGTGAHTHHAGAAHADGDDDFAGDASTTNVYIWGLQHEYDSVYNIEYPTSIIYTTGSAVTRTASVLTYALANNSTPAARMKNKIVTRVMYPVSTSGGKNIFAIAKSSDVANNHVRVYLNNAGLHYRIITAGNPECDEDGAATTNNGTLKRITAYYSSNAKLYVNRVLDASDNTTAIANDLNTIYIGQNYSASQYSGLIKDFKILEVKK
jgi:hypothetical protein